MLNTKQVRAIAKAYTGPAYNPTTYTDKTIKKDKTNKRRSVVFCFWGADDADKFYAYMKASGMQNKIKRTGGGAGMHYGRMGGEYVRVIAEIG